MTRGAAALALVALFGAGGCRLDPECFRSDECASGLVCQDQVCVSADAGDDARPDGGDAGVADAEAADGGDAGAIADPDAEVDGGVDAGPDAGPDGGTECIDRPDGGPLADLQAPFGDQLVLHFDEPRGTTPATVNRASADGDLAVCNAAAMACPETGVCGAYGRAYRFRGAPLSLDLDFSREAQSTYGLEMWIRRTGTSTGCVFQLVDGTNAPTEITLCIGEDGRPFIDLPTRPIGDPVALERWTHLAVRRYDGVPVMVEILQDGVQTTIDEINMPRRFLGERAIVGGDVDSSRGWHFEGDIDELRLADHPLDLEVDMTLNRPHALMVWQSGPEIWLADENGFSPRRIVRDGRWPRLLPDLTKVLYLVCEGPAQEFCNVWDYDVANGMKRQLTTRNSLDIDVGPAINFSGSRYYMVEPAGCGSTVYRAFTRNMNNGEEVVRITDRRITSLDVGFAPGGADEMLVFTTESCTGPFESRVERLVDPTQGTVETVFSSTSTDLVYENVRANPFAGDGSIIFDRRISMSGQSARYEIVRAIAETKPAAPILIRDDARAAAFALRGDQYVYTRAGGEVSDLVLWDYARGGDAERELVTGTSTATQPSHPNVRAALFP